MLRVLTLSTLFPDATRPQFGVFVLRQTQALAALPEVEVRVAAPLGLPPLARLISRYADLARLPRAETWEGLRVLRPRFRHLPGLPHLDADALARALAGPLAQLRRDWAFDVIDAQFFWPDGPAAVALGRRLGIPVSIKARGGDIHHWGRHPRTGPRVAAAAQAADGVLAVSEAMADDVAALGRPRTAVRVHRTGLDPATFHVRDRDDAKAALGIAGPLLVCVGALIPRKGQGIALAALARLPGVTLALIGRGADEGRLRAQAETLGVGERVRFLGSLPPAAVADWLAAANVSVLPTESEGLANAWVESLACGTPVVTTDVGGARTAIASPAAGRLVAREDRAVADAIAEILAAPPPRDAVAQAVAGWSWMATAQALRDHLAGLVRAGAAPR